MKRIQYQLFILLCFLVIMWSQDAKCENVTINDIEYSLFGDQASVCSAPSIGYVTIPASVIYNNKSYTVTSISSKAFKYCVKLTGINLPNTITIIGTEAFYGCSSLSSVTIPNSVTTIRENAFQNCYSLTSVTIPNSVTSIGVYAFYRCRQLKEAILGHSITSIEKGTFCGCDSLESIVIPNSVTSIGASAFSGCEKLKSVSLGNSVEVIGIESFAYCKNLEEILLPNSLKTIGNLAFSSCKSLSNITIPQSVTYMGHSVFRYCDKLTKATIHGSINTISVYTFESCSSLKDVILPNTIKGIGEHAFYGCNSLTSMNLPNSVETIGLSAFASCSNLSDITLPSSLTTIDGSAFAHCIKLSTVSLPSSLQTIGNYAFSGCTNLTSISLPSYLVEIGNNAFQNCSSLADITIPDPISRIEKETFKNCTSLSNINLPSSLTFIGISAFEICKSLTNIIIPNSVTKIGASAFKNCINLTAISMPSSLESIGKEAFRACSNLEKIAISGPISRIEENTFISCTKLSNVSLPTTLTFIGVSAFENCKTLPNITLPSSVTDISASAFKKCTNLTAISLPSSISTIGASAFAECDNLSAISLPSSLVSIGSYAFNKCCRLVEVIIPSSISIIEKGTFSNCSNLSKVYLPNSLSSIGDYAFYGCTHLTAISLPSSLENIGNSAFSVSGLKDIYVDRIDPSSYNCASDAFASSTSTAIYITCALHFPMEAEDAYRSTVPWSYFFMNAQATSIAVHPVEIFRVAHGTHVSTTQHYLTAEVLPENTTNKNVTWISSDPQLITVNSEGVAKFVSNGNKRISHAEITATTTDGSNLSSSCKVTVFWFPGNSTGSDVPQTTLYIDPSESTIKIGNQIQMHPTFEDEELNTWAIEQGNMTFQWKSQNESVATIDSNGNVTGTGVGTTQIQLTAIFQDGDEIEKWEAYGIVTVIPEPVLINSMAIIGDFTGGWPTQDEGTGEWDWTMAAQMTQDTENAAIWTLTLENVRIEAKKYEYKAVANNSNDGYQLPVWGNRNFIFGTEDYPAGTYNLVFTVDTDKNELTFVPVMLSADDDLEKVAPMGWTNVITNGNCASEDVSSFAAKEYPSTDIVGASIVAGAGKNNSRGVVVKAGDDTGNPNAASWDSMFWIILSKSLPCGTKLHVEFDYMASKEASVPTQAHGVPDNYQHWAAIGNVNFSTEWQHFSKDIVVSEEMAATYYGGNGLGSIAFLLQEEKSAVDYHFDNFGVWYKTPTYTVVGAFYYGEQETEVSVFGKDAIWDPTNTEGDMVLGENGIYTWTKNNVQLEAGTLIFNVMKNHDWNYGYGLYQDFEYVVNEAGTYSITIKFNPDATFDNGWNVDCVMVKTDVMNGDANGDGKVDIADVTAIINKINNVPPASFDETAADVNGDGKIDIADVTGVINIINQ